MTESQAARDAADCVVVYCGKCNGAQHVCVTDDLSDGNTKDDINTFIAGGSGVTHMPVTQARKQAWCKCERAK